MITQEIIQKYIQSLEIKGLSENYKRNFLGYARKLIGKNINQELIDQLSLMYKHKFHRSFLRSFTQWYNEHLENNNQIPIKVKIAQVKIDKKEIIVYSDKELATIFDFYRYDNMEMYLITKLMYEDGLRVDEAVNLKKSNFDMVNLMIRGDGKGGKEFVLPISSGLVKPLELYLSGFDKADSVFPLNNVKRKTAKVWYQLKRDLVQLFPYKDDHKSKKAINCHAFRHSCGTNLMKKGWNLREIQEFLRHSSLSTTERYTKVDKKEMIAKWRESI